LVKKYTSLPLPIFEDAVGFTELTTTYYGVSCNSSPLVFWVTVGYTFVFGKQVYTIREVGFCRLDAITVRQPTVSKPWQFDTVLHDIYIVCQGHDMSVSLAEDGVEVSIV